MYYLFKNSDQTYGHAHIGRISLPQDENCKNHNHVSKSQNSKCIIFCCLVESIKLDGKASNVRQS